MKKKVIGILLSFTLMASITACGTEAEATNQEVQEEVATVEQDTETEEGEAKEQESNGIETEHFFIYTMNGNEEKNELEINDLREYTDATYTVENDVEIYTNCSDELVGYLKAGSTVSIDDGNDEWVRITQEETQQLASVLMMKRAEFKNAISGDDLSAFENLDNNSQTEDTLTAENTNLSEEEKKIQEALSLIDENKTYTPKEVQELYPSIMEVMGKTWNAEMSGDFETSRVMTGKLSLDGATLKEETRDMLYLILYGMDGLGGYSQIFLIASNEIENGQVAMELWYRP